MHALGQVQRVLRNAPIVRPVSTLPRHVIVVRFTRIRDCSLDNSNWVILAYIVTSIARCEKSAVAGGIISRVEN